MPLSSMALLVQHGSMRFGDKSEPQRSIVTKKAAEILDGSCCRFLLRKFSNKCFLYQKMRDIKLSTEYLLETILLGREENALKQVNR